jgi:hypothetical protein
MHDPGKPALVPCLTTPGIIHTKRGKAQDTHTKVFLQGQQIEEDPDDFGTQGKKHRVKKEKEERSRKSI